MARAEYGGEKELAKIKSKPPVKHNGRGVTAWACMAAKGTVISMKMRHPLFNDITADGGSKINSEEYGHSLSAQVQICHKTHCPAVHSTAR